MVGVTGEIGFFEKPTRDPGVYLEVDWNSPAESEHDGRGAGGVSEAVRGDEPGDVSRWLAWHIGLIVTEFRVRWEACVWSWYPRIEK